MLINPFDLIKKYKSRKRWNGIGSVLIPLIRRVAPTAIANSILGVQPMTGPVGRLFNLKYKFDEEDEDDE